MNQAHPEPSMRARGVSRCSWDASSRSAPDECTDFVADGIHRVPAGCFDVEAAQGPGAGRAEVEPAAITQGDGQAAEPVGANPGPGPGASISSSLAGTSSTWQLISPEATYRV